MMTTTNTLYARAGAAAIAAVLALSSTPGWAQEAPPPTTDAAPAATPDTAAPAPATEAPAATSDDSAATADTAAPAKSTATTTRKVKRVTKVAMREPAPAPRTTTRSTVARSTATRSTTIAAPAAASTSTTVATTQTSQSKVKPIVDLNNKQTTTTTTAAAKPARKQKDDTVPIAAGGALAFLAIGGAAVAATRRRHEDEEFAENETMEPEAMAAPGPRDPIFEQEPAMIAPSASAFGGDRDAPMTSADRKPGETWVERAYRGPTADNPSQSLRKRLKRAAFFDKREREVAAGEAMPVDTDAGLPENMPEPELA